MQGDWVVAIATVLGAIIGALIAIVIWYFNKDRSLVRFILNEPQDLAAPLRSQGNFEIKFGDHTTCELVSAGAMVENIGNTVIKDFECEIVITGIHNLCLAGVVTTDDKLRSAVKISFAEGLPQQDPCFKITTAYFNPGESFQIRTLADGVAQFSKVTCRLPSLRIKFANETDVLRSKQIIETLVESVGKGAGISIGVLLTAIAAAASLLIAFH
jgi:hypothetical protein